MNNDVIIGDMIEYNLSESDYQEIDRIISDYVHKDKEHLINNDTFEHKFEFNIDEGVILGDITILYTFIKEHVFPTLTNIKVQFLGADRDGAEYIEDLYINVNRLGIDYTEG